MHVRKLGGTGLEVSAIGLGTLAFTGGYGPADEQAAVALIRRALDSGVTFLDTADFYAGGQVERTVGRAIAGYDEAVVATRGGALFTPEGRPAGLDGSPAHLRRACDASLARLGVDRIDLYYLARVDPAVPLADSIGALADLVAAGKVAHIGVSEVTAEQLREAAAVHPIAAVASEYSLMERGVETNLLPTARQLGVGLVACSPLGRGMLTSRLNSLTQLGDGDYRHNHPRFAPENFAHNRQLVRAVEQLASDLHASVGRLSLAWLLAQGPDIVPIPSSRNPTHLELNSAATQLRLTPDECAELCAALPAAKVAGDRLPRRH
jgi:aryl-alcohol dehydrogenase-like predicted oxidoreductase